MKKHIVRGILALGLLVAPATLAATASADQATGYQATPERTQSTAHDAQGRGQNEAPRRDTDWGWLGLIGLGGLAGLLKRPTQQDDASVRQRTGYRAGEPIGSR